MHTPFRYQTTDYDCVPTSFINAIQYLFNRNEIPPAVVQKIMLYSLDTVDKHGDFGKHGTTGLAIQLILQWLESFSDEHFIFKNCEYLPKEQIHLRQGNKIIACLNRKGVALLRVSSGKSANALAHYMLALGVDEDKDWLLFFDPYYRVQQFSGEDSKYLEWLGSGGRQGANLRIKRERLDSYEYAKYSMAPVDERECCLLERR